MSGERDRTPGRARLWTSSPSPSTAGATGARSFCNGSGRLQRLAQLGRRRRTGETLRRLVDATREAEGRFGSGERVPTVDEDRWRADEPQALGVLGGLDPLED